MTGRHGDTGARDRCDNPGMSSNQEDLWALTRDDTRAPQGTDLKRLEFNPGNQYPNKTRHLGHKT